MLIFSLQSAAVCVSQLLNTWVTSSTDGLIRQKNFSDYLSHPPAELRASLHVWMVNVNRVPNPRLSQKSVVSTLSPFSSASSLIFMCFMRSHLGAVCLHQASASHAALGADAAALLKRTSDACLRQKRWFSFTFSSVASFRHAAAWLDTASFQARGCFSESARFLLFVRDSSSSVELHHTDETKWKTQLLLLMNTLTMWRENKWLSQIHCRAVYVLWVHRNLSSELKAVSVTFSQRQLVFTPLHKSCVGYHFFPPKTMYGSDTSAL